MIKQRMNQMACSLRGKLCAKNLLCDREAMRQIEDNNDEFIRFYTQMNLGRSCETPDKVSSVADLFSIRCNERTPIRSKENLHGLSSRTAGIHFRLFSGM
jgi:hypothetical protein